MIDISELWISTKDSTDHSWMKLLTTNRPFKKKRFFFSMIWFNHTFGQICSLTVRTVLSDDWRGPLASYFLNFIKKPMRFVESFLFQIPSSTPYLQSLKYPMPSHPTRLGILYRLHHLSSLQTSTLSFKQQRKLQTTPLNNVNSRPLHWTMWTPLHLTVLNWTPVHHIELFELQTTSLSNVNSG